MMLKSLEGNLNFDGVDGVELEPMGPFPLAASCFLKAPGEKLQLRLEWRLSPSRSCLWRCGVSGKPMGGRDPSERSDAGESARSSSWGIWSALTSGVLRQLSPPVL